MTDSIVIVRDAEGHEGQIVRYDSQAGEFHVVYEEQEFIVPKGVLASVDADEFSFPMTFRSLEAGVEGLTNVVIPVAEESIVLKKNTVEKGRVLIHKVVEEREVTIDEPVREGRVEIERIAIDQEIDEPAQTRVEGNTTIIPVMKEVLKVHRQLVLVEEIRLTVNEVEVRHPQTVTLRSENVEIERIAGNDKRVVE